MDRALPDFFVFVHEVADAPAGHFGPPHQVKEEQTGELFLHRSAARAFVMVVCLAHGSGHDDGVLLVEDEVRGVQRGPFDGGAWILQPVGADWVAWDALDPYRCSGCSLSSDRAACSTRYTRSL